MFEKILVPLDGSERSQAVLTHLQGLLEAADAHLVLLGVVSAGDDTDGRNLAEGQQARSRADSYLRATASKLRDGGLAVSTLVREGFASEAILAASMETNADLIAMSSHGYGGFRRLYFGSTTERVLRASDVPVLVVKSWTDWDDPADPRSPLPLEPLHWRNLLVPLDGSPIAERAIPTARALAQGLDAKITLFRAAPVALHGGYYGLPANVDVDTETEAAYLRGVAQPLREQGIEVDVAVARGTPSESLVAAVADREVDLVVMTTHGRTGLRRWLLGSVAESLLRTVHTPILLLREGDSEG